MNRPEIQNTPASKVPAEVMLNKNATNFLAIPQNDDLSQFPAAPHQDLLVNAFERSIENAFIYPNNFRYLNSATLDAAVSAIHDIRDAIKLSAKFFENTFRKWGVNEQLPLHLHASEVSVILLMAGASKDLVIAGFLHDVGEGYVKTDTGKLMSIIERKFGSNVVNLINSVTEPPKSELVGNWSERKMVGLQKIANGTTEEATLSCAAKISTIAAGNKFLYEGSPISAWSAGTHEQNVFMFKMLRDEYIRKGVPDSLLNQYDTELYRFAAFGESELAQNIKHSLEVSLKNKEGHSDLYSHRESGIIRNSLKLAVKFAKDEFRSWGPVEKLPLYTHSVEVASLLLAAGARKEVVAAGALHDVLGMTDSYYTKRLGVIERKFGKETLSLILSLAEPHQTHSPDNWAHKTAAITQKLENSTADQAMLSCATRIGRMAEYNKFLHSGAPISSWSSGTFEQNLSFFSKLRDIYIEKNVPGVILAQFDLELARFANSDPKESHSDILSLYHEERFSA